MFKANTLFLDSTPFFRRELPTNPVTGVKPPVRVMSDADIKKRLLKTGKTPILVTAVGSTAEHERQKLRRKIREWVES